MTRRKPKQCYDGKWFHENNVVMFECVAFGFGVVFGFGLHYLV